MAQDEVEAEVGVGCLRGAQMAAHAADRGSRRRLEQLGEGRRLLGSYVIETQ